MLGKSGEYAVDKDGIVKKGEDHEGCIKMFNHLLSDFKVLEQSILGLHWMIEGPAFFDMHAVYGDMYKEIGSQADDLAERVRAMGGRPPHCFECFLKRASLEPIVDVRDKVEGAKKVVEALEHLCEEENALIGVIEKLKEDGITKYANANMDVLIKILCWQEKMKWQLSAYCEL